MKWPKWLRLRSSEEADKEMEALKERFRENRKRRRETSADASKATKVAVTMMREGVTQEEAEELVEAGNGGEQ